ncbi:hypothetical protein SCHPADRAFT_984363 [Schizopora paradoxa]|uniref:Uncharacterized protein n=1 Tax=Schizopora paradoxa TaxID=27342 RepID=A0A0H2RR15_9AGAM|nr:hypothetical protein SCHPADRAFT_984363 [Schizopora paradoxa]
MLSSILQRNDTRSSCASSACGSTCFSSSGAACACLQVVSMRRGSCALLCPACPRDLPELEDEPGTNPWTQEVLRDIGDSNGDDENGDIPELEDLDEGNDDFEWLDAEFARRFKKRGEPCHCASSISSNFHCLYGCTLGSNAITRIANQCTSPIPGKQEQPFNSLLSVVHRSPFDVDIFPSTNPRSSHLAHLNEGLSTIGKTL